MAAKGLNEYASTYLSGYEVVEFDVILAQVILLVADHHIVGGVKQLVRGHGLRRLLQVTVCNKYNTFA